MDLDPQIAEAIVTNLKDIIRHEINLFNTSGEIIASTDRSRIGTGHDGARLAIKTRENVVIDTEHEFKGAKHGINVPVIFNNSPVAVIGITGEPEEVEPFGNVIKKMTEILIRENYEQVGRFERRERMASLAAALVLRRHDHDFASYLASVLDINLERARRVIIARMSPSSTGTVSLENIYDSLHIRFQTLKHSFFSVTAKEICLFIDEKDAKGLTQLLDGIDSDAERLFGLKLYFGIGNVQADSSNYWKSYNEANRTVEWLRFLETPQRTRATFEELDIGAIISSIPAEDTEHLTKRVFGNLSDKEIDSFQQVFDAYTKHNGSIIHCAQELYLHKNTLQNRLNSIAKKTGFNPRNLSDFAVLAIAFRLRNYTRFCEESARALSNVGAAENEGTHK